MIVGIPTDDGVTVSEHFGRSRDFMIARLEDDNQIVKNLVENPHNKMTNEQAGHGSVLKMLTDNKVNKVICVHLNPRMEENLRSLKITVEMCRMNSRIDDILGDEQGKRY